MTATAMNPIATQVANLDSKLFSFLEAQSSEWDRQALLALHTAAADICGEFAYLEIGSYLGGSLQAVMRDPRCNNVISIDSRPAAAPDTRGRAWDYEGNSTEHMLELLHGLPDVDMGKLTTIEATVDALPVSDLPVTPTYCFIDGEHTYDAVLRDARFCAEALGGEGVILFHDYVLVGAAISMFLRECWDEISFALAFSGPSHPFTGGGVFALEMGDGGLLRHPAVERAIGSRWHTVVWQAVNRPRRMVLPFLLAWAAMPAIDTFLVQARHGFREYVRLGGERQLRGDA
jgi:Methyltransferase domain